MISNSANDFQSEYTVNVLTEIPYYLCALNLRLFQQDLKCMR